MAPCNARFYTRVVPTGRVQLFVYTCTSVKALRVQNRHINVLGLVVASYGSRAMLLQCAIKTDAPRVSDTKRGLRGGPGHTLAVRALLAGA
eukprot:1535046-Pleurochrysis_carterae.AAC.3